MHKIANLLKTPKGAQTLKSKLKAMPEKEKSKANYQKIWKIVCDKVNEYNLQKMKLKKSTQPKSKDNKTEQKKSFEVYQKQELRTQQGASQKRNNNQVKSKNKRTQKFKQPQFSEQDITKMIIRLEYQYPKIFNERTFAFQ